MRISIPVSVGELVDRITILRIKNARIGDPEKRAHVSAELRLLEDVFERDVETDGETDSLPAELHQINERLWGIEDELRELEAAGDFGPRFVEAARRVYHLNDERHRLKRAISDAYGSEILEEKSYSGDAGGSAT